MRNTIHVAFFSWNLVWGTVWLRLQWHHLFLLNCHRHLRLADSNTTLRVIFQSGHVRLVGKHVNVFIKDKCCFVFVRIPTLLFPTKNKRNHDDFLTSKCSIRSWLSSFLKLKNPQFFGGRVHLNLLFQWNMWAFFWGAAAKIVYPKFCIT